MQNNGCNVIDLFCGCGGFSLGFKQAGFHICAGVDSWVDATNTYAANFPEAKVFNCDITTINGKQIANESGLSIDDVDVIIGGPPCQGFSVSGKRLIDDPRNILYKSFVSIVGELKPKIFVMENVPGLVRLFEGKIKENIIHDFSALGYNVAMKLLSAEQYGVPQQRKRVFFVGLNKDVFGEQYFEFPKPQYGPGLLPPITTKEAISDLDFIPDDVDLGDRFPYGKPAESEYQKRMRGDSKMILNHSAVLHTAKTKSIIALVPDGGNYKSLPKELRDTRKVNIAWTRMDSHKPCFTIDTGHNHHFHYKENRVPTVRESARIQSFPDAFEFTGIKTHQLKQVGNAVPPLLAEAIAHKVEEFLRR